MMEWRSVRKPIVQVAWVLLALGLDAQRAAALNCKTDSDCATQAICELTPYQTCQGDNPACPAGSACGDKPVSAGQTNCATYLEGICRSPWELPCRQDADCGSGFRCLEQVSTWCRGGGSVVDGGASTSWMECGESRGTFACELAEQPCSADADCAAGLRCQEMSDSNACGARPIGVDGGVASDCGQKASKVCAPPDYFPSREAPGKGATTGNEDGDRAPPFIAADGGVGASSIQTNSPSESPAPTAAEGDSSSGGDGCSLASRRDGEALWFGVLAAIMLVRRRRTTIVRATRS
jgi:hypothetical protein